MPGAPQQVINIAEHFAVFVKVGEKQYTIHAGRLLNHFIYLSSALNDESNITCQSFMIPASKNDPIFVMRYIARRSCMIRAYNRHAKRRVELSILYLIIAKRMPIPSLFCEYCRTIRSHKINHRARKRSQAILI